MTFPGTFLWIGLSGLLFLGSGCKDLPDASVNPELGAREFPVNGVVRVRFDGLYKLKRGEEKKRGFKLIACSKSESGSGTQNGQSQAQTTPNPSGTPSGQTDGTQKSGATNSNTSTSQSGPCSGTPVAGRIFRSDKPVLQKNATDGTERTIQRSEVFFIPIPESYDDTPLAEDTEYSFTADVAYDEQGNVFPSVSTKFHTVKGGGGFQFAEKATVSPIFPTENDLAKSETPKINPSDTVIVRFDQAVLPTDVSNGTQLCYKNTASTTPAKTTATDSNTSDCSLLDGSSVDKKQVVLIENFEEDPDTHFITAKFDTYGIQGVLFRDGVSFTLQPDLGSNGGNVTNPDREISFKGSKDVAAMTATPEQVKKFIADKKQEKGASTIPLEDKKR